LEIGGAGMTNFFFLPEGLLMRYNKRTYNALRQLYDQEELHIALERFGIKYNGSDKMRMHVDVNMYQVLSLFYHFFLLISQNRRVFNLTLVSKVSSLY